MKKTVITIILSLIFILNISAQDEESKGFSNGDNYVSGSLNYNPLIGDSDVSGHAFSISPVIGAFVTDNLVIEALLIYSSSKEERENNFSSFNFSSNTFAIGLGASYFFMPMKRFSFTMGMHGYYGKIESSFDDVEQDPTKIYNFRITPGVSYFLSDSFLLVGSIGSVSYSTSKIDAEGAESNENLEVNLNMSNINLGLTYRF